MALIASPPPKAKLFPFAPLRHHSIKQAKPNSQTITQKHQDSLHYATTIKSHKILVYKVPTQKTEKQAKMALIASPPPKAKLFPFAPLRHHSIKQAKPNSQTITQKHQDSLHYATTIRNTNRSLIHRVFTRKNGNNKRVRTIFSAASIPDLGNEKDSSFGRILLSDVVVKRRKNIYRGRKWNSMDVATVGVVVAMHLMCIAAPFTFNWGAFSVAVGLYVISGLLGITLSFHRNLSHRSFKLPKWLEFFFAYCGVQALQGNPIDWVSTHRYHHQFCDTEKDPHSPLEGFWFSHMSWLFDTNSITERCGNPNNVSDLEKQPFYKFLRRTYVVHPVALGALLYALGGFPYIVWGMGVRIVWVYHITWLVNSACHVWGKQAWNTGDLSRNNWWVALLAFGEGWHNNHHAFEYSARHGLEWWQIDMTWYVVQFLQAIGLASEVKLPTTNHKQRLAFGSVHP